MHFPAFSFQMILFLKPIVWVLRTHNRLLFKKLRPLKTLKKTLQTSRGARFSKVPLINGPGKLSPFTLKIERFQ